MVWFLYNSMIALDTLQVGAHSLDTLSANLVMFEVVFFEKDQTKLGICGNSSYTLLIRYIVGRGFLTPYSILRISPFISHPTPTPFSKIFPISFNFHPHYSFCCLVSLTEWVIAQHLMCYFTYWYYGSTHMEPWYLSTRKTLLCVLCNMVSRC